MAGEASVGAASLPYHEPGIVIILIQASFLLLLNIVNAALDRILYCGLLGQVLIGIAWGTPGANWLSVEVEKVIVQLGYLGLILLVYEGKCLLCACMCVYVCVCVAKRLIPFRMTSCSRCEERAFHNTNIWQAVSTLPFNH